MFTRRNHRPRAVVDGRREGAQPPFELAVHESPPLSTHRLELDGDRIDVRPRARGERSGVRSGHDLSRVRVGKRREQHAPMLVA